MRDKIHHLTNDFETLNRKLARSLTKEESKLLPALSKFLDFMRDRALEFGSVHRFRNAIIGYARRHIRSSDKMMSFERILEKRFWDLRDICRFSAKLAMDCLAWSMYTPSLAYCRNYDRRLRVPPFPELYYSSLYPFPNINTSRWEKTPRLPIRREKLRKMYFDDAYRDDWTRISIANRSDSI